MKWTEYVVKYQARNCRQVELATGERWAWHTTEVMTEQEAVRVSVWINTGDTDNVRAAQVVRRKCKVVSS
ncbi:MAG TPA: hypothetical protein VHL57_03810 [Flavobacteriales bacterium]|nr:hypothetical protein [Flavobacteriales bacterium]